MQLRFPIFPKEARIINEELGIFEHDWLIQYLVNGLPVHCVKKKQIIKIQEKGRE